MKTANPCLTRRVRWMASLHLSAALGILVGCQTPPGAAPSPGEVHRPIAPQSIVVGRSLEGRALACQVLGDGGEVVLIMATIHGNEPAGTPLVRRLIERLAAEPKLLCGRRVVVLPVANPDGLAGGTRRNARGVDLNRNFPATNWRPRKPNGPAPLSEPESRAIHDLLERYAPIRIVSIHQPIACIDYDGPGRALAQAMAASSGLPLKKLGGKPGSLGSYAGINRGIPIITVELPRSASRLSSASLWARYGRMLLTAIAFPDAPPPMSGR